MTTECLCIAWEKALDAHDKLVLMWLADGHDFNQSIKIDPTLLERLARFSDQSFRKVYKSIKHLVAQGHLEWADENHISVLIPMVNRK